MNVRGLMVPLITPKHDGGVDVESLQSLLEFQLEGCADSIFVVGTTGEFQYLSVEEKKAVVRVASEITNQRLPLLVGVSSLDMNETIELLKTSERYKAQAVVLAPMYGNETPQYLIESVIQNSSMPVLLYNNPLIHDGTFLPLQTIDELSDHPSVIGIKDSSGDWDYFSSLLEMQKQSFSVLQGKESHILKSLRSGADGIVAGAANINPEPFCDILYSHDEEIMQEIIDLKAELKSLSVDSIPSIKQKLFEMGIISSAELFT